MFIIYPKKNPGFQEETGVEGKNHPGFFGKAGVFIGQKKTDLLPG
jgi:hypothetical protein